MFGSKASCQLFGFVANIDRRARPTKMQVSALSLIPLNANWHLRQLEFFPSIHGKKPRLQEADQEGPSLFEGLKNYRDMPMEPLFTLDPNSASTQPREAWKEPLTKPEMLAARLEAKRHREKTKKAKAMREGK